MQSFAKIKFLENFRIYSILQDSIDPDRKDFSLKFNIAYSLILHLVLVLKRIISLRVLLSTHNIIEQRHEFSNNVVWATIKVSDQPMHMRSLIRAFASRFDIL